MMNAATCFLLSELLGSGSLACPSRQGTFANVGPGVGASISVMRQLPIVISPIQRLFEREDADIALISVELWPSQTIVRLAALVDDAVAEEPSYGRELDRWGRGGREGAVPDMPGERRFRDAVGTLAQGKASTRRDETSCHDGSLRAWAARNRIWARAGARAG
jgi:hypothetical protein